MGLQERIVCRKIRSLRGSAHLLYCNPGRAVILLFTLCAASRAGLSRLSGQAYNSKVSVMKKILFLLAAISVLVGCQSKSNTGETVSTGSGTYQDVTPAELSTMLESRDGVLVNVHIPFAGNIPGTDASIPYNEIQQNLDRRPGPSPARTP